MTLVEFLKARLDEEDRDARLLMAGGYAPDVWHVEPSRTDRWTWVIPYSRTLNEPEDARCRDGDPIAMVTTGRGEHLHVARHASPARVLAEVDAKRRIMAEHDPSHDPCDAHDASFETIPCDTLLLLALPYADHPDYREEWRP